MLVLRASTIPISSYAGDSRRVSYQFCGLEEIKCLTAEMRSVLGRLIAVKPEDLLMVHDVRDGVTKDWVYQLNAIFYESKDRYVCKQADSPAPTRRTSPVPVSPEQSSKRPRQSGRHPHAPRSQDKILSAFYSAGQSIDYNLFWCEDGSSPTEIITLGLRRNPAVNTSLDPFVPGGLPQNCYDPTFLQSKSPVAWELLNVQEKLIEFPIV
ncbi:uncharacterized protein VP01_1822g7 [Puccinia sorghi]|uniref:Uncharacterized protein n=1 Tax=Puccinia sorghi TaxID=27349 RepID=A0A0L6VE07_9BASI|nr:uncharacterized protein VP01_1822g7 [Puccinia sorghi]